MNAVSRKQLTLEMRTLQTKISLPPEPVFRNMGQPKMAEYSAWIQRKGRGSSPPGSRHFLSDKTGIIWKFNSRRPRQNGCHVAEDIWKKFQWIKMFAFRLNFSLIPTDITPGMSQMMARHPTCHKPLSEPLVVKFAHAYVCHSASMSLRMGGDLAFTLTHWTKSLLRHK